MKIGDRPVRYAGWVYLVVLLLWFIPVSAFAGIQLNFEWDPNPEPGIAGYRVFSRLAGANRGQVYLYVDECLGVASVGDFSAIDADSVQNVFNRPEDLFLGLFHVELVLENIGGIVTIPIYFSAPINGDVQWYIYNAVNGWLNYSDHSRFSEDGMSIVLDLKDGGYGDVDGVENGVIVFTSGPGHVLSSSNIYAVSGQSPTTADGGCFIDALFP